MGHPHDPEGHSHHTSVWISHYDVDGVISGITGRKRRIIHQGIERFVDGQEAVSCVTVNAWTSNSGTVILTERRRITVQALANDELMLTIDMLFEPRGGDVTFGKTLRLVRSECGWRRLSVCTMAEARSAIPRER